MASEPWINFFPAVGAAAEQQQFLRSADSLLEASRAQSLVATAEILDEIRRDLTGRRATVPTAVRAAGLVLADLVAQGWMVRLHQGRVEIAKPPASPDPSIERERVRRQLHVERDRQLQTSAVRAFIERMERRSFHLGRWVSVYSLMRDGSDLARRLQRLRDLQPNLDNLLALQDIVRPYLQVVREDEVCPHTGLLLSDIWRYFRHTWANPYRSVPGRSLMILVRDAAVEPHPVIGIAALASSAVQIGVRDEWIGWTPEAYVADLKRSATERHNRWLLRLIEDGIAQIYQDDLLDPAISPLSRQTLAAPASEVIAWLEAYSRTQRDEHQRLADADEHKRAASTAAAWDDNRWRRQAETPLFRSKRAETLAMLLRARLALGHPADSLTAHELRSLLESTEKRQAIQALVRRAKSERVGVAMADISVCGAVAPYSFLLGGKLVAMLLVSPEVVVAYRERYSDAESVIASSLAGRPVVRPAHLVFLGTTSLYGTEPTQYTRVSVPIGAVDERPGESVRYRLLGRTEGYGTLQFSSETVDALATLLSQSEGGQRVHSIFGEGVNPRLRKIRDGLDRLALPSDTLLTHGSPRLVYGVALARNFREYLLGLDTEPDYFISTSDPAIATKRIARWWAQRWLLGRIRHDDVLLEVARHQLTYPVRHGARAPAPSMPTPQLSLFDDIVRQDL